MARVVLSVVLLLGGCTSPGCQPMLSAQLLFGAVDDAAFTSFLDQSVTPRFPAGLTVFGGAGRWQAPDGRLTEQKSKVVLIVTTPGAETRARLDAIRADYKARFNQQSVGLVLSRACADF